MFHTQGFAAQRASWQWMDNFLDQHSMRTQEIQSLWMLLTRALITSPFTGTYPTCIRKINCDQTSLVSRLVRTLKWKIYHAIILYVVLLQAWSETAKKSMVRWAREHHTVPNPARTELHLWGYILNRGRDVVVARSQRLVTCHGAWTHCYFASKWKHLSLSRSLRTTNNCPWYTCFFID